MSNPEADPADVEEQHRVVTDDDDAPEPVDVPLEAPEADVLEQSQSVPIDEDEEAR